MVGIYTCIHCIYIRARVFARGARFSDFVEGFELRGQVELIYDEVYRIFFRGDFLENVFCPGDRIDCLV